MAGGEELSQITPNHIVRWETRGPVHSLHQPGAAGWDDTSYTTCGKGSAFPLPSPSRIGTFVK